MRVVRSKSNLGCEAGCGLPVSWLDHGRVMLGSFSDRPRIGNDVSPLFGGRQAQYLVKFKCHFSWQAQYLVKWKWQAQ